MLSRGTFYRKAAYWLALGFLLAVSVLLLFDNLGIPEIHQADEARHGVNAYEMMQNEDYLISTYRGETDYWNLKPPLSLYGIILGFKLFGCTPFGMRFYSAASMFGMMVVMALWMKKRLGSGASLVSQLFLMACSIIYGEHFARFGDADSLYVLFYTLSMLSMLESARDIRWLYGSALCFGLAFMAKSWHAALIPVTCFLFVCLNGQIKALRWKHYLLLIFFGILPIAPWAIARIRYDGMEFFKEMLATDVLSRATTVHEDHVGGWLYYVKYLLSDPAIALAAVLCIGVILGKIKNRSRVSAMQLGILLWFFTPVVLYSLCVSKLRWYVFVCPPALAVASGVIVQKLFQSAKTSSRGAVLRTACAALCTILFAFFTLLNLQAVSSVKCADRYDTLMRSMFDRTRDSGKHAYIQYECENAYKEVDYRIWLQDEVLCAQLAGDLICLDGGDAAFAADSEPAYLIAHDMGLNTELLKNFELVYDLPPLKVFKNQF